MKTGLIIIGVIIGLVLSPIAQAMIIALVVPADAAVTEDYQALVDAILTHGANTKSGLIRLEGAIGRHTAEMANLTEELKGIGLGLMAFDSGQITETVLDPASPVLTIEQCRYNWHLTGMRLPVKNTP